MRRALLGLSVAILLAVTPAAVVGSGGITYSPSSPTTTTGVSFTVTIGGGNRDFASVSVNCQVSGTVIYSTVLTVAVTPKGTGTSATIYPPASSCVADLVKLNQIGSARVLASTGPFTVSQAP